MALRDKMEQQAFSTDYSVELYTKIRNIEENIRLIKDRVLLIGHSHIEEREKNFNDIQELKREMIKLKEENDKMSALLQRLVEQLNNAARKEELAILQRQFDLFREK